MPTFPPALEPIFATAAPDRPIQLFRGSLELRDAAHSARGRGSISMILAGGSRIAFRIPTTIPPIDFADETELRAPRIGVTGQALVTSSAVMSSRRGSGARAVHSGVIDQGLQFGDPTGLEGAYAHVFNFPSYVGDTVSDPGGGWRAARVVLNGGGWRVTLDGVREIGTLREAIRRGGGHAITHVAMVERDDGSAFDAGALDECIAVLGYTLSFARGAWTFPGLIQAFGGGELGRWHSWPDPRLREGGNSLSWFDDTSPSSLSLVFNGLWAVKPDPDAWGIWAASLGFLMDTSAEINLESRVVLAQAGLERLAWQRLVREGRWTAAKFNDKQTRAVDKLRELLKVTGASAALPPSIAPLAATPGLRAPIDGPGLLVAVRNRIVHPPKSGMHFLPSDVVIAAWRLCLEYQHLAILSWLGYSGPVVSPIDYKSRPFP